MEGMRNRIPSNKISSPSVAMAGEENELLSAEGRRISAAISLSRKKGKGTGGLRSWLVIDATGNAELLEVGKHVIMRRAGLPARDLRILDPVLSYPSTILGRERAIVINLEHIKAIITSDEVLLLDSKDPVVAPFADDLQRRLPVGCMPPQRESGTSDADMEITNSANLSTYPFPRESESTNVNVRGLPETLVFPRSNFPRFSDKKGEGLKSELTFSVNGNGPKILPFEFRALEACLEAACSCLETETITLEKEAYPALDELTTQISTLNLERVRQIKNRLVAISGRVQKLREYVDDTEDYINIMLDDKQNQLLQMGVMLSTAALLLNCAIVVMGLFGMNIDIGYFDPPIGGTRQFLEIVIGTISACVVLYTIAIVWGKKKRLLE